MTSGVERVELNLIHCCPALLLGVTPPFSVCCLHSLFWGLNSLDEAISVGRYFRYKKRKSTYTRQMSVCSRNEMCLATCRMFVCGLISVLFLFCVCLYVCVGCCLFQMNIHDLRLWWVDMSSFMKLQCMQREQMTNLVKLLRWRKRKHEKLQRDENKVLQPVLHHVAM